MPKSPNQKLKLLYLMKLFLEKTDEIHHITVHDIIKELKMQDISVERKTVYDDIAALQQFGMNIETVKSQSVEYFLAQRDFELPELKLLVDSVQASRFITHKKSAALIKKLEGLASQYDAQRLQRQVYVSGRIKSMNESVYYNIDEIHSAIAENQKISFKYFEYTINRERRFKHGGKRYQISPMALIWSDENYYLLGYDAEAEIIKHYRIDKMSEIQALDESRQGLDAFEKIDMGEYSNRVFSMFGGRDEQVKLLFCNPLIGVVIDRFGKDVFIMKEDTDHFSVRVNIKVSMQFYGWLAGFGAEAKILAPEWVKESYLAHIKKILG